jgi:hypothetical protein
VPLGLVVPSTITDSPAGTVWNVTLLVRGSMSRCVVAESPVESVTVRKTRYQTFVDVSLLSGIVNCPVVEPAVSPTNGWECMSWWKSTRHENADAPSVPSSASVAEPE